MTKCKAMSGKRRCRLNEEIVHAPFCKKKKNWFEDLLDWTTLVLTKKCNEKKVVKVCSFLKRKKNFKVSKLFKKSNEFEVRLSFSQKVWEVSSRLEIEGNSLHPLEFFERLTAEYFFPLFGFFRKAAAVRSSRTISYSFTWKHAPWLTLSGFPIRHSAEI